MLRSRVSIVTLNTHRSPWSTRHKSTVEDLTRRSRVKPLESEPQTVSKSGITIPQFSRILQWTLVPSVFGYMALYADFGEQEHIFSPLRRLAQRSKDGFWELSPEEKRIVESEIVDDSANSRK